MLGAYERSALGDAPYAQDELDISRQTFNVYCLSATLPAFEGKMATAASSTKSVQELQMDSL